MKELEKIFSKKNIDFLKSVKVNSGQRDLFNQKKCFFRVKKFYSLSDVEVLIKVKKEYDGRFKSEYFIIADVDNGDYLLMNEKGNIFLWNHEINDLGYSSNAEEPLKIANDITQFLDDLVEYFERDIEPEVKSIKLSDDFNSLFKDFLK